MSFIDPALNWILVFTPIIGILIVSIILGVISTVVYKYASDQKKIKELKDKTKEIQKKIKKVSKENPQKAMEMNSELMKLNGPMMKETMKPMFYTLIPSLLILAWMSANLAFMPIVPGQTFEVTAYFNDGVTGNVSMIALPEGLEFVNGDTQEISDSIAIWQLKSDQEATYTLTMDYHNQEHNKDVIITYSREYIQPETIVNKDGLKKVITGNEKIRPLKGVPIFGGLNWLWSYIILTVIVSSLLKKFLKVY